MSSQSELDLGDPVDPVAQHEQHLKKEQRRAAALLNEHFRTGSGGPAGWSMAADLRIWKRLAGTYGPEAVNGAILVARDVLNISRTYGLTMLIFNGQMGEARLNKCIQAWRRKQEKEGESARIAQVLRGILTPSMDD